MAVGKLGPLTCLKYWRYHAECLARPPTPSRPPRPPGAPRRGGGARGPRDEMGWKDRGIDAARFAVVTVVSSRLRRARGVGNNAWRAWRVLGVIASVSDLHIRSGSVMSLNRSPRPASRTPRCPPPCPASPSPSYSPSPVSPAPHPLPLPLSLTFRLNLTLSLSLSFPSSISSSFHQPHFHCPSIFPLSTFGLSFLAVSFTSSSIFVLFSMLRRYTSSVAGLFLHYSPSFLVTRESPLSLDVLLRSGPSHPLVKPPSPPPPFQEVIIVRL